VTARAGFKFDAGWRAFDVQPSSKTAGEGTGPLNGLPAQMVNRFSHRGCSSKREGHRR
jgi:hypothetical protein